MLEDIWRKLGKKKKEEPLAKEPTFEELKAALPEDLREEFQELGQKIEKMAGDGEFGERSFRDEDMTPEDRKVEERYDDLTKLARKNYFGVGEE